MSIERKSPRRDDVFVLFRINSAVSNCAPKTPIQLATVVKALGTQITGRPWAWVDGKGDVRQAVDAAAAGARERKLRLYTDMTVGDGEDLDLPVVEMGFMEVLCWGSGHAHAGGGSGGVREPLGQRLNCLRPRIRLGCC